jgi:transposase
LGPSGRRLGKDVVETNGRALIEYVRTIPGERYLCLEEGEQSQWLVELLAPHVTKVEVIQPEKRRGPKDDAHDAFEVAEIIRTGRRCRRVYKELFAFRSLREASRVYSMLTADVVRLKNRVKSFYRGRGVGCTGTRVFGKRDRESLMEKLPAETRRALELVYRELDEATGLHKEARGHLIQESHKHSISRTLETAPGLGPIRVAQLLPIVVTPHRFRTSRQFWAYCGLAVVTHSSSDWDRVGGRWVRSAGVQTRGLNRNRNGKLKDIFKGAATLVCGQLSTHPLHQDYQSLLEKGVRPTLARVTIARKIAAIVLAMWKQQTPYDSHKHQLRDRAA